MKIHHFCALVVLCLIPLGTFSQEEDYEDDSFEEDFHPSLGLNAYRQRVGPVVPASVGQLWPKPQSQDDEGGLPFQVRPSRLEFQVMGNNCDMIEEALKRYYTIILTSNSIISREAGNVNPTEFAGYLDNVKVNIISPCEEWPYENMDESYAINVNPVWMPGEAYIESRTNWGMLRALETFSQLIHPSYDLTTLQINSTRISDFPRFPHRSLLLDSSRHFLKKQAIFDNLDLMAMNKFNIMHWHITDNEAFPFRSDVYPNLSAKGSYNRFTHEYTKQEVREIIEYARFRGIRVIPEFDTPGHTQSWGPGQPNLLTTCYNNETELPDGTFGHVDVSNEENYIFFQNFFAEVLETFPDSFIHLGGDEVDSRCWASNPKVVEFMEEMEFGDDYTLLQDYHMKRMVEIINSFPDKNRTTIGWQEVFFNNGDVQPNMRVHLWIREELAEQIANVTLAGHKVLVSACWFLDQISWGVDWHKYYYCDPQNFDGTEEQKQLVMGGGPNMWAEMIDSTNLIPLLWPRAAVPAERLWSASTINDTMEAAPRLEEHRCRLLRRGYNVQPINGAGFCLGE